MPFVPPRALPDNKPGVSAVRSAGVPAPSAPPDPGAFRVISHEALFAAKRETRCDACGALLASDEREGDDGIEGRGVYLWARGDQVTLEEAPLCHSCASAIGMTALARWEIEEEEG